MSIDEEVAGTSCDVGLSATSRDFLQADKSSKMRIGGSIRFVINEMDSAAAISITL